MGSASLYALFRGAFQRLDPAFFQRLSGFRITMSLTEDTGFDPSTRRLCPDGACTGILEEGGWCSECRKTWVNVPVVGAIDTIVADENDENADVLYRSEVLGEANNDFDVSRQLCPDGACTGVIGADHRCSVCGIKASQDVLPGDA
jgi:hypothetical protein